MSRSYRDEAHVPADRQEHEPQACIGDGAISAGPACKLDPAGAAIKGSMNSHARAISSRTRVSYAMKGVTANHVAARPFLEAFAGCGLVVYFTASVAAVVTAAFALTRGG